MTHEKELNAELNARVRELARLLEQVLEAQRTKSWDDFEMLTEAMDAHHERLMAAMSAMAANQAPI